MKLPPTEQERLQAETNRLVEKLSKPYFFVINTKEIKLSPLPGWVEAIELPESTVVEQFHISTNDDGSRLVLVLRLK